MNQAQLVEFLDNLLKCPIKRTRITDPVMGHCGHSVSNLELLEHFKVSQEQTCPSCKTKIPIIKSNKLLQKVLMLPSVQKLFDSKSKADETLVEKTRKDLLAVLSDPITNQPFSLPCISWEYGIVFDESTVKALLQLQPLFRLTFYPLYLEAEPARLLDNKPQAQKNKQDQAKLLLLIKSILENNLPDIKNLIDPGSAEKNAMIKAMLSKPLFVTGETILHLAATVSDIDTLKLIKKTLNQLHVDIDVLTKDNWGQTPLMCAVVNNNKNVIPLLCDNEEKESAHLQKKAINEPNPHTGQTALHLAASSMEPTAPELIHSLLENKADVSCMDNNKKTALFIACESGNINNLDVLLNRSYCGNFYDCVDIEGNSLLHVAIKVGNEQMVSFLIRFNRGNLLVKNKQGITPLQMAVKFDRVSGSEEYAMVKTLFDPEVAEIKFDSSVDCDEIKELIALRIEQNDVNTRWHLWNNIEEKSRLLAKIYKHYGYEKISGLINCQSDENSLQKKPVAALFGKLQACTLNNIAKLNYVEDIDKFIKFFEDEFFMQNLHLKKFAPLFCDIYFRNGIVSCRNILKYFADQKKDANFAREIIEYINSIPTKLAELGIHPIHFAANLGCLKAVELILNNRNTDINAQVAEVLGPRFLSFRIGETALHIASYWNYYEIVQCLVKHGADISLKNMDGKTALRVAYDRWQVDKRTLIPLLPLDSINIDLSGINVINRIDNTDKNNLLLIREKLNQFHAGHQSYNNLPFFYIRYYYGEEGLTEIAKEKDENDDLLVLRVLSTFDMLENLQNAPVSLFLNYLGQLNSITLTAINPAEFAVQFRAFLFAFFYIIVRNSSNKNSILESYWPKIQILWNRLNLNQKSQVRQLMSISAWENYFGVSVLHLAVTQYYPAAVDFLINELRMDVNALTHFALEKTYIGKNQNPLHVAVAYNHYEAIDFLVEAHADYNLKKDKAGRTVVIEVLNRLFIKKDNEEKRSETFDSNPPLPDEKTMAALLPLNVDYIEIIEVKEDEIIDPKIIDILIIRKELNNIYNKISSADGIFSLDNLKKIQKYYGAKGLLKIFEKFPFVDNNQCYLNVLYTIDCKTSIENFELFVLIFEQVQVEQINGSLFAESFLDYFCALISFPTFDAGLWNNIEIIWKNLNADQVSQLRERIGEYLSDTDIAHGQTLLHQVVRKGYYPAVQFLVEKLGANVDETIVPHSWPTAFVEEQTALHIASSFHLMFTGDSCMLFSEKFVEQFESVAGCFAKSGLIFGDNWEFDIYNLLAELLKNNGRHQVNHGQPMNGQNLKAFCEKISQLQSEENIASIGVDSFYSMFRSIGSIVVRCLETQLHYIILEDDPDGGFLLNHALMGEKTNKYKMDEVEVAAAYKDPNTIHFICDKGFSKFYPLQKPYLLAASIQNPGSHNYGDQYDIINYLISRGARVDLKDCHGDTPLAIFNRINPLKNETGVFLLDEVILSYNKKVGAVIDLLNSPKKQQVKKDLSVSSAVLIGRDSPVLAAGNITSAEEKVLPEQCVKNSFSI